MKCSNCNTEMNENTIFCPKCGIPIEKDNTIFCSQCGSVINNNDVFCPKCGKKLVGNIQFQCSVRFKFYNMKAFNAGTKPFILNGGEIKIIIDNCKEISIPPNPTETVLLSPGEHDLFIYLEDLLFKFKKDKTYKKISIENGKHLIINLKFPIFSWQGFQLIIEDDDYQN